MVFCNKSKRALYKSVKCHNPYFNRWFSAMMDEIREEEMKVGHNPYFNRWFSAIYCNLCNKCYAKKVTILILIDGFLQYNAEEDVLEINGSHNPYFNRWFSAITYNIEFNCFTNCHNPYFNRWFSAMSTIKLKLIN